MPDEPDDDNEWDEEREDEKYDMLVRAAEMGYVPTQMRLSMWFKEIGEEEDAFVWSQQGAAQGDCLALHQLGYCYRHGICWAVDDKRGIELYRQSAALDYKPALHDYGLYAFGHLDWERYFWWEQAASRYYSVTTFYSAILLLVPSFEEGQNSRILHSVGPLICSNYECSLACGCSLTQIRKASTVLLLLL
jgi:TPR repeat protein